MAKQGVKGAVKTGAKAAATGARNVVRSTAKAVTDLVDIGKSGARALVRNGKIAMKGVRKGFARGAKTFDDLGQRLSRRLRFRKFRISVERRRFKLEGQMNPWVLLASGKIEERDIPGVNVGDAIRRTDGSIEGMVVGTRGSRGGPRGVRSSYVEDLQLDEIKAFDEFQELTAKGMDDVSRGNRIRGSAASERVSLRKDVREEYLQKLRPTELMKMDIRSIEI